MMAQKLAAAAQAAGVTGAAGAEGKERQVAPASAVARWEGTVAAAAAGAGTAGRVAAAPANWCQRPQVVAIDVDASAVLQVGWGVC